MIRLSRLTDYAVALLSYMGREAMYAPCSSSVGIPQETSRNQPTLELQASNKLWAASDLAEKSGLPMPTVAKILKLLAKNGVVLAQRGAAGGYRLGRPIGEISIAAIIEAMDGPIAITDCSTGSAHQGCNIESICPMSDGWNKVNRAVKATLENMSLAEMNVLPVLHHVVGE